MVSRYGGSRAKITHFLILGIKWIWLGLLLMVRGALMTTFFSFGNSDPLLSDREILWGLPIWVQMYNVPLMWRTVNSARAICKELGLVLSMDSNSEGFNGLSFLRARIKIDVADPLPSKITITLGQESRLVNFKFERLPNLSYNYGMLDHVEDYCNKPPLYDDKGNLERWGEELRGYLPRKAWRASPVPARPFGSQRKPPLLATPPTVRLPDNALLPPPAHTGRELFKRKRVSSATTPRSSHADMEGLEVEVEDAWSRPSV